MMRICLHCSQESRTQSWVTSVVLFVFWRVCWNPLVVDACKQTDHVCVLWDK
jgi:hypothetical protein